jgi:hypothetical protein
MLGESKGRRGDFYCCAFKFNNLGKCSDRVYEAFGVSGFSECSWDCSQLCHKHPTLAQFKEEYGKEWEGAVYYRQQHCENYDVETKKYAKTFWDDWEVVSFKEFIEIKSQYDEEYWHGFIAVCACTPFVPDNNWRPE